MKVKSESEVAQSCPTLRDPMDCSLPGSSIHGIFQARVLEWGAIAFSEMITERPLRKVVLVNPVALCFTMIRTEFSASLGVEAGHGCSASHERRGDSHPDQALPGDREMERHSEKGCLRSRASETDL